MGNSGRRDSVPRGRVPAEALLTVSLTRTEISLIIDALLQAEMTLPMIDRRHESFQSVEMLRVLQLSLAHRLEDLMADARESTARPARPRAVE